MIKPGKELDKLVAEKAMSLKVCECDHDALRQKAYDDYIERCKDPYEYHGSPQYFSHGSNRTCNYCNKLYMPVIDYSTNINHAWDIVEKLKLETITRYYQDKWLCTNVGSDFQHYCEIEDRYNYLNDNCYCELGETAPHAICLAALKIAENNK